MLGRENHILWFWLPTAAYMLAIFWMSSISLPPVSGDVPDYVLHGLEYFLLALLLIRLLLAQPLPGALRLSWRQLCLLGMLVSILYGASDEFHQYFVPGRHCSLRDLAADAVGSALACGIAVLDERYCVNDDAWFARLRRFPRLFALSYAAYRQKNS